MFPIESYKASGSQKCGKNMRNNFGQIKLVLLLLPDAAKQLAITSDNVA